MVRAVQPSIMPLSAEHLYPQLVPNPMHEQDPMHKADHKAARSQIQPPLPQVVAMPPVLPPMLPSLLSATPQHYACPAKANTGRVTNQTAHEAPESPRAACSAPKSCEALNLHHELSAVHQD